MKKRSLQHIIASSLGLFTLVSLCLPHSAWAGVAGRFQFVAGDVRIVSTDGRERAAIKGGEVNEKESIFSGKTGSAQLRMIDDGIVAVRPETELRIDEYKFADKEDGTERGFFSLLKGGFRSITGLIGRSNKNSYGIRTPSATIGIRGTDHETIHLTAARPNLPEGTYNKVNAGATVVNGTLVGANQVAYAPNLTTPASILPHIPSIFETPKGSQQGRDDRKQQDADNTDGRQQAKSEKTAQAGLPPASGSGQPAAPSPPVGGPMPLPPPQNLLGSSVLPPPPPPSSTLITGTTGSGAVTAGNATLLAPSGTGVVGGDISMRTEKNGSSYVTGPFADSDGIVAEGSNQTILFDATTKRPILVAEKGHNGGMNYTSGTAQFIESGNATVGSAQVVWGRYVGADQFIDSQDTRDPITMSLMFTDQAMNFNQAHTYFKSNSHTFNIVPGAGNVVDNLGSIYSASGTLSVTASAGTPVSLLVNAISGTRSWAMTYNGGLQDFYKNGLNLTTGTLIDSNGTTNLNGKAGGVFIGPDAAGALTSYSANAINGSALIGSLQGTSLFKKNP